LSALLDVVGPVGVISSVEISVNFKFLQPRNIKRMKRWFFFLRVATITTGTEFITLIVMKSFFILLVAVMISCAPPSKETSGVSESPAAEGSSVTPEPKPEFDQFLSLLPVVPLPFAVSCEKCCGHPAFDHDHPLVKKYVPEGAHPVGLIFKNERYSGILATYAGDMLIASVIVYDRSSGKKTSDRNFMTGYCGRDFDFESIQHFYITEDLLFNSVDTVYSYAMDSVSQEIVDTLKVEINQKAYYIDAHGRIEEKQLHQ
jgi:hypothetical protein